METKKIRAIITGSTGMVGEGVLLVCLERAEVEQVLVINRKPCGVSHPKLKEIIHADFYNLTPVEDQLSGYNACCFCLGISSVGISKEEYYKITYTLTMHAGGMLSRLNPEMTFCYISGAGTNSSEKGGTNWSRVKGKTENDLMKLPFKAYGVRPGFIKPVEGQKHVHPFYKYINWMFPLGRKLYPKGFCKLRELALTMISVSMHGYSERIIEGEDIIAIAAIFLRADIQLIP